MKQNVYSVYDVKAGAYMRPFFTQTEGMATRAFIDEIANADSPLGKHPEDYSLYRVSEFDELEGRFIAQDPVLILTGNHVIASFHAKETE